METLRIENFAGIDDSTFALRDFNVFIGPQASGKSVTAKLVFYFREALDRMIAAIVNEKPRGALREEERALFLKYFPARAWRAGEFVIEYAARDFTIRIARATAATIAIDYSERYDGLWRAGQQGYQVYRTGHWQVGDPNHWVLNAVHQGAVDAGLDALTNDALFIPAGRSFFASLRASVFSLLTQTKIDPLVARFGSLYERMLLPSFFAQQSQTDDFDRVLRGTTHLANGELHLEVADGTQIAAAHCSSGQQELLPLVVSLRGLGESTAKSTLFIEEPEAHLFPDAQRLLVAELVRLISPGPAGGQLFVTTHSPYVLGFVNNLMLAGQIVDEQATKAGDVDQVLDGAGVLLPGTVAAFHLQDGKATELVDPETGLIQADRIDAASGFIGRQFQRLLDIAEAPEDDDAAAS